MDTNRAPLAPFILIALALIGLGDVFYLSYFQYLNLIPTCAIGGCETVLTSEYSKFFGVPWSYIGLAYYGYMLALSVLLAIDPNSRGLRLGALAYTGFGVLYSIWAIFYIQLTLIGALCQFCAISATVTLALFITSVLHYRTPRV
ncbi:MAG: Vitamin epoxide reductase [Candidatus Adlerbacteria bacterium]|nr:Vitamin epoxide reductase [Candidatus Adlerbacteria bacterium]